MLIFLSSVLFFVSTLVTLFIAQFFLEFWYLNFAYCSIATVFCLLIVLIIIRKKSQKFKSILIISIAIILWVFTASIRLHFTFSEKNKSHISNFVNTKDNIKIIWKICNEIDNRANWTKYTLCTISIEKFNNWLVESFDIKDSMPVNWKILLNAKRYPIYNYWDIISITWKISVPKEDKDFSYKNYLSRYEIYWLVQNGHIKILKPFNGSQNDLNQWQNIAYEDSNKSLIDLLYFQIFSLKSNFLHTIWQIYPEPHWSLLAGILVWSRKWLPEDVMNDFRLNWLAHIIAISGYNITLIIIIMSHLLAFLPRKTSFWTLSISIILFTIFVWGSSAVIRASIMWILWLLALSLWRPNVILNSMLFTAFLMSIINPKILWWDIWFQLSFLALIWIIWLMPMFPKIIEKIPNTLWFRESVILTLSASIMTSMLMAYHFWFFSLVSPITNIFIAPLLPLIMFFWFFSAIFQSIIIQQFFGFITYCFLDLLLFFSHFFASFKYASIELKPWWILTLWFYIIILFFMVIYSIIINRNMKN